MSACKYFMKTVHPRVVSCMRRVHPTVVSVRGYCQNAALTWRKPKERRQRTHGNSLRTMIDKNRLLTDSTNHTSIQVSPCIIDTHKREKFSKSVCWALVASLTEEMAARSLLTTLMEQQTVTHSAVIHGLCTMTLNQQCIARSGSPPRW